MISEKDVIERIRECITKEQLFTVFEETSNNEMKFWDESIYKTARGFLKQAMGNPETHYGPQHGHLSEKEMFEWDVEVFLTRAWEYGMNLKSRKEKAAFADTILGNWDAVKKDLDEGNWDKYITAGPNNITACVPSVEQYKVYQVYPCDCAYVGYSLVAASSVEDANRIIQDFKNSDPHNDRDSYAYGDVSESDLIEDLISTREGIILEGF